VGVGKLREVGCETFQSRLGTQMVHGSFDLSDPAGVSTGEVEGSWRVLLVLGQSG
jgi:hypothetical protein